MKSAISAQSLSLLFMFFAASLYSQDINLHTEINPDHLSTISDNAIKEKSQELEQKFKWAQNITSFGKYVATPAAATYLGYLVLNGLHNWWRPKNNTLNQPNDPNNLSEEEIEQVRIQLSSRPVGWYAHAAQFMWFLFPIILQVMIEYAQRFLTVFSGHDLGYYVMTYSSLPSIKDDFEYKQAELIDITEQEDLDHMKTHIFEIEKQLIQDMTSIIAFIQASVSHANIKKEPLLSKGLYIKRHTNRFIQQIKQSFDQYDRTINIDEQRTVLRTIIDQSNKLLNTIENEIKTFTILTHKAK